MSVHNRRGNRRWALKGMMACAASAGFTVSGVAQAPPKSRISLPEPVNPVSLAEIERDNTREPHPRDPTLENAYAFSGCSVTSVGGFWETE